MITAWHALTVGAHMFTIQYMYAVGHLFTYLRIPGLPGAVLLH